MLSTPTSPAWVATTSISMTPSEHVVNRMPLWRPLTSCMTRGEEEWTGATLAGWVTAQSSIPSHLPESPAEARTQCREFATMAWGTRIRTTTMCFASPPTTKVKNIVPVFHLNLLLYFLWVSGASPVKHLSLCSSACVLPSQVVSTTWSILLS